MTKRKQFPWPCYASTWNRPVVEWRVVLVVLLVLAGCDGGTNTLEEDPGDDFELATLEISAPGTSITSLLGVLELTATGKNAMGNGVRLENVTWAVSDASVLQLLPSSTPATASVRAVGNGTATVTATVNDLSGTIEVTVAQQVARVIAQTGPLVVELPGDERQVEAEPADVLGSPVTDVSIVWSTANPQVATVDATGRVVATGFGTTMIQATAGDVTDEVAVEVIGDRFFLNGNVRLRYELDLPNTGEGPFPALVFVHGSGQVTRNGQRGVTDPLVSHGMAVLRYDKRGVGASTGTYTGVSTSNSPAQLRLLASDAAAALRFLSRLPNIDTTRLGLAANSQGGWIAPLATTETDLVSYLMIWSGPTVSVGMEIFYSNLAAGTTTPLDDVYPQLDSFIGMPGYDPLPLLQELTVPSIWLFGENDRSIPVRLDTLNMHRFQAAGLPYDYVLYPFAGHDLRDTRTGTFHDIWSDWVAWLREQGVL